MKLADKFVNDLWGRNARDLARERAQVEREEAEAIERSCERLRRRAVDEAIERAGVPE